MFETLDYRGRTLVDNARVFTHSERSKRFLTEQSSNFQIKVFVPRKHFVPDDGFSFVTVPCIYAATLRHSLRRSSLRFFYTFRQHDYPVRFSRYLFLRNNGIKRTQTRVNAPEIYEKHVGRSSPPRYENLARDPPPTTHGRGRPTSPASFVPSRRSIGGTRLARYSFAAGAETLPYTGDSKMLGP